MRINLKKALDLAKAELQSVEQKIENFVGKTEHRVTVLVDKFCDICGKAGTYIPIVESDINNPIVQFIISDLGGQQYVKPVLTVLNRVAPLLKTISSDKTVYDGAIHHIAAEILVQIKNGQIEMNQAIDNIQKFFVPIEQ